MSRMNRSSVFISRVVLGLAALLAVGTGYAQAADYKIGFVNTERLFREAVQLEVVDAYVAAIEHADVEFHAALRDLVVETQVENRRGRPALLEIMTRQETVISRSVRRG